MAKAKKYNLTIIDQTPEVNNFVYRGISEADKAKIITEFHDWKKEDWGTLQFSYDEGEAHLKIANVHSMVFSDYVSQQEEDDPREDE
jgi:hypothetical protein